MVRLYKAIEEKLGKKHATTESIDSMTFLAAIKQTWKCRFTHAKGASNEEVVVDFTSLSSPPPFRSFWDESSSN
jgi:hypothetical protein